MDPHRPRPNLKAMGSLELVRLSVESNALFKLVALELRRRPADAAATELVVALFRAGQAPPWLAALLLGSVRGPEGYAVACEILLSAPGMLAESYAGPAMARILGRSSRPDLVAILCGDWPERTCEGAAYGLAELRDPDVVDDVLRARRGRRITSSCAGSVVAAVPGAPALLAEWLAGEDECKEDIAIEAAVSFSARPEGLAERALAEAVRDSLDAGRVKVSPRIRRMLGERAARLLDA